MFFVLLLSPLLYVYLRVVLYARRFYHILSSFTLIFCCCVSRSWFGVHDPCGGGVHSPGRHPYRPRPVPTLSSCLRLSSRSVFRSWILTLFRWGRCRPGRGCGDSSPLVLIPLSPMDYVRPSVSWGWPSAFREALGSRPENIE